MSVVFGGAGEEDVPAIAVPLAYVELRSRRAVFRKAL